MQSVEYAAVRSAPVLLAIPNSISSESWIRTSTTTFRVSRPTVRRSRIINIQFRIRTANSAFPIPHSAFKKAPLQGIEPRPTVSKTDMRPPHSRGVLQWGIRNVEMGINCCSLLFRIPHSAFRIAKATHTGFEPVVSTLTKWRPLQNGPMGRDSECGVWNGRFLNRYSAFRIPHSEFKKSALRESNSPDQIGSLAPLPIGQEHK